MSEIIQLITAVTAFVAVIVSPILTIYVARKQIRASVVSTNRQAWINTVRGTLADYLAKQAMVRNLNKNCYADDESLPRIEETVRLTSRIELLMNPKEPDHSKLVELVCEMTNALTGCCVTASR